MLKKILWGLAAASGFGGNALAGPFAAAVVSYQPGSGGGAALTNALAALGAPATVTPGDWVTPFNPPYLADQIVSLGAGGSLTVRFDTPITDDPHPYGLDFLVHGNTMFVDAAWPNGQTDPAGATFGECSGQTAVWVSADGVQFYRLNPSLAPVFDGLFPTDGQGQPGLPVNPALTRSQFSNMTLAQVRALYGGAAGGAGYDLAWAQDSQGQSVNLPSVSYVRLEVLSDKAEIDALVAVPEPAAWLLALGALPLLGLKLIRRHPSGRRLSGIATKAGLPRLPHS
jgi:hypothetical protein